MKYRSILRRACWLAPQSFAMYEGGWSRAIRRLASRLFWSERTEVRPVGGTAQILQIARRLYPGARYPKAQKPNERKLEIAKGEFYQTNPRSLMKSATYVLRAVFYSRHIPLQNLCRSFLQLGPSRFRGIGDRPRRFRIARGGPYDGGRIAVAKPG